MIDFIAKMISGKLSKKLTPLKRKFHEKHDHMKFILVMDNSQHLIQNCNDSMLKFIKLLDQECAQLISITVCR